MLFARLEHVFIIKVNMKNHWLLQKEFDEFFREIRLLLDGGVSDGGPYVMLFAKYPNITIGGATIVKLLRKSHEEIMEIIRRYGNDCPYEVL